MQPAGSIWDGWTGDLRSPTGQPFDAWTFLIHKYGRSNASEISEILTPRADFACVSFPTTVNKTISFQLMGCEWKPVSYPLNVILFLNYVRQWTPEDFINLDLQYQFTLVDANNNFARMLEASIRDQSEGQASPE